jgi:hypothetical protein
MFDPDGDQTAADSTRSSTTLDTGSSVNPRTARRLVTASYMSMIAYLPPAIAMPVMKDSGTNATSLVFVDSTRCVRRSAGDKHELGQHLKAR